VKIQNKQKSKERSPSREYNRRSNRNNTKIWATPRPGRNTYIRISD